MKKLVGFFLIFLAITAQYKPEYYDLVQTTFLREFDKTIIENYLTSEDDSRVNAALLSISQSGDSTFFPPITNLDFEKYGGLISFAVGQLGPNKKASKYLLNKLVDEGSQHTKDILKAIGKCGNEKDLKQVTQIFKEIKFDGYPLAVYHFRIRGIIDSTESDISILLNNLKQLQDEEKLFESLFALYRTAPEKVQTNDLENIITGNYGSSIKLYALGILRKQSSFPFSFETAEKLLSNSDWSVRCEAARAICFYPFQTEDELNEYTNLLRDENPNVARAAATSLINLNMENKSLKENLINQLGFAVVDEDIAVNVRGDILLTLQKWQPEKTPDLYREYQCMTIPYYTYALLGSAPESKTAFKVLKGLLNDASDYTKSIIYLNIMNHYDSLKTDSEFSKFVLDQYSSTKPFNITLNNFVIDSSFAVQHKNELNEKIKILVKNHVNDHDYNQAISTLFDLTDRIDTGLTQSLLSEISKSKNYSLQFDLKDRIPITESVKEYRKELFKNLFSKAFNYSKAVVQTSKGDYTIEFYPNVAPMSVGNFIHLTEQNFYKGIIYHRVVPDFVIQTGDPSGTGWGGVDYTIVSEFSQTPFKTYYVGMASAGKDTEGSQWFVMNNYYPHLNGNYTNFGKVVSGFDVVNQTDEFDVIYNIKLID